VSAPHTGNVQSSGAKTTEAQAILPGTAPPEPARQVAVRLLGLSVPIAGTNLLAMLMGIVDSIIVGRHSAEELAQLALAWSLNGTSYVAVIGLLVGVSVMVARRIGEDRPELVGAIWRRGVVTAVLAGTGLALLLNVSAEWALRLFGQDETLIEGASATAHILALSLVPMGIYMASAKTSEALSRPRWPLIVLGAANVVNLIAALLLVPQFGAEGAAWATLISRLFCAVAMVGLLLAMPDAARFCFLPGRTPPRPPSEVRAERRDQLAIGFAAMGSRVLEAASFNAMTIFAGVHGVLTIAVFSIFMNTLSFGFMPSLGLAAASAVLASQAIGAGEAGTARKVGWIGLGFGVIWGLAAGVIGFVASTAIAGVFTTDPAVVAAGAALIAAWVIVTATDFSQVVLAEVMRATGATWFPTVSHLGSYIGVMMPLGWYLCVELGRGAQGLMEAVAIASLVSLLLLLARWALLAPRLVNSR
jgi:MATE family multidrug resistance protein